MKNIVKFLAAITIIFFISCETDDNGRFQSFPETGWVEFSGPITDTQAFIGGVTTIEVPVTLTAPINTAGLQVSYELQSVSGDNPNTVVNTAGTVSIESGTASAPIVLNIDNTAVLGEDLVFDVVLTSTNRSNVSVGLSDGSQTIAYRVTLLALFCVETDLTGTYDSIANGDVGDGAGGSGGMYPDIMAVVTLTDMEGGIYEIDDMSFGLYPQGYADTAPPGRIQNVCDVITGLGDVDQYGDPFTINGTVDNESGVISLTWSNTWGDTGVVTLTPQ